MYSRFQRCIFISSAITRCRYNKMGTFVSNVSPVTGKLEWSIQADDYDFHQEIARSAYADMLHDTERNKKYYEGLKKAVSEMRRRGKSVHVLDIGTGTGLLSMMAAELGADSVTACEAFDPMAACAKEIIRQNGFTEKINLIPKRSTEISVGDDGDMKHRANILVTEVFDTELIGEGALGTFSHAHNVLLEKECIVVPSVANMYVQLVNSDFISRWNQIQPIRTTEKDGDHIIPPASFSECGGAPSLHDLQLDQLPRDKFEILSEPIRVFRFDFTGSTPIAYNEQSMKTVRALTSGTADAVLMWWDLEMDLQREIILSCAPSWAHPKVEELQWRDHWMQAIYYPGSCVSAEKGEELTVISNHDEYSLWFDVTKSEQILPSHVGDCRSVCTCGGHMTYSRTRLGLINDTHRQNIYRRALAKHIDSGSVCVSVSDGSLLPLVAARLGAKKVFAVETHPLCSKQLKSFVEENQLQMKVKILEKRLEEINSHDFESEKISLFLGEPFFNTSLLPWHNLYFWYAASELSANLRERFEVLPAAMTVKAVAVEFSHLWKIRAPVGKCEGFQLAAFDNIIDKSSHLTDANVEPQPLWEYPCTALSEVVDLMSFDFTKSVKTAESKISEHLLYFVSKGICNGVAIWADFDLGDSLTISTGPQNCIAAGEKIQWDIHSRQGVHLLRTPIHTKTSDKSEIDIQGIDISLDFKPQTGDLDFNFSFRR